SSRGTARSRVGAVARGSYRHRIDTSDHRVQRASARGGSDGELLGSGGGAESAIAQAHEALACARDVARAAYDLLGLRKRRDARCVSEHATVTLSGLA